MNNQELPVKHSGVHSDKPVEENYGYMPHDDFQGYEYSQPYTITGSVWPRPNNTTDEGKIISPFGVDSEVSVLYYSSSDNAGICMVTYDMPIPTPVPSNTTTGNFIASIFKGNVPGTVEGAYFVPVKDFVGVYANMPTGQFVLSLQFRREKVMYTPHEEHYFGDPSS